jgi:hypothetical protein
MKACHRRRRRRCRRCPSFRPAPCHRGLTSHHGTSHYGTYKRNERNERSERVEAGRRARLALWHSHLVTPSRHHHLDLRRHAGRAPCDLRRCCYGFAVSLSLPLSLSHFADAISTHHHLGRGAGRFGAAAGLRVVRGARPVLRGVEMGNVRRAGALGTVRLDRFASADRIIIAAPS